MSDKNHKKRAGCAGGEGVGSAKGVLMNRKKLQEKTENTVCVREEGGRKRERISAQGVGSAKGLYPRG